MNHRLAMSAVLEDATTVPIYALNGELLSRYWSFNDKRTAVLARHPTIAAEKSTLSASTISAPSHLNLFSDPTQSNFLIIKTNLQTKKILLIYIFH